MRKDNKNKGFTLFEFLVVVFIIALLSSILIVNWRENEKQYHLQRAVQEVAQNIRKAQDMALNGFRYDAAQPAPPRYGIFFDATDPDFYYIFADKDGDKQYKSGYDGSVLETINLKPGMTIDSTCKKKLDGTFEYESESDISITFTLPDGFTTIDPNKEGLGPPQEAIGLVIIIRKINGVCPEDCKTIIVEKTGRVDIGDWVNCI